MLIEAAQNIEQESDLFYTMAKTYTDVSSQYIINQVNSINLFISQNNDQKSAYLREISSNATLIAARIIQLAENQQNEHFMRMENRRQEYQQLLMQIAKRKQNKDD